MKTRKFESSELILICDANRGIYCPRETYLKTKDHLYFLRSENSEGSYDLLLDPNNEFYYEVWDEYQDEVFVIDGKAYNMHHLDDVWLIPVDMDYPET